MCRFHSILSAVWMKLRRHIACNLLLHVHHNFGLQNEGMALELLCCQPGSAASTRLAAGAA